MHSSRASHRVSNRALIIVLVAQFFCLVPLFLFLPLWTPALLLFSCLWRYQIIRDKWTVPPTFIKGALGIACMAGLYLSYGLRLSIEPLVGLLACGVVLKIIEAQKISDAVVVIFVCLVVTSTQLLFSQSLGALVYALFCIGLLLASMASVWSEGLPDSHSLAPTHEESTSKGWRTKFAMAYRYKKGAVYLLQAIPVACLLFFVMPRIPPLWTMPDTGTSASTGFSETMAPGGISELIKSPKVAFRVTFFNQADPTGEDARNGQERTQLLAGDINQRLPNRLRYWRGLVLNAYDGRTWRRSRYNEFLDEGDFAKQRTPSKAPRFNIQSANTNKQISSNNASTSKAEPLAGADFLLDYSVILEPHQERWLFSINAPIKARASSQPVNIVRDSLVKAKKKVLSRFQYDVRSHVNKGVDETLDIRSRGANLTLPKQGNRRARQLADNWVQSGLSASQISNKILSLFNEQFTYTLNPPGLGADAIDEFLFVSRRGFCEHFSSTYVFMMRAANIPARVVVGYLGGEVNALENYMVVRQSDAHAWAEVWFEGSGWTRVDPTSAVAPERIERSLSLALNADERSSLAGGVFQHPLFQALRNRLEATSYLWHRYIVAFDNTQQSNMLTKLLGGTTPWKVALLLILSVGLVMLAIFMLPALIMRKPLAYELKLLRRFERKCRRLSIERKKEQSPAQLADEVGKKFPHLLESSRLVGLLFEQILYADNKKAILAKLERAISNFNGSKRAVKRD